MKDFIWFSWLKSPHFVLNKKNVSPGTVLFFLELFFAYLELTKLHLVSVI